LALLSTVGRTSWQTLMRSRHCSIRMLEVNVAYSGTLLRSGLYRGQLTSSWTSRCRLLGIPVSSNFSLQATLASAVEVGWIGGFLLE
jgi:hypothetical protein